MSEYGSPAQPAGPERQERTLVEGILYYLGILLRYRVLIISVTVLAAVASVTFSIISLWLPPERSPLPNRYQAQATLLLGEDITQGGTEAILLESLGMSTPGRGAAAPGRLALQVLYSRSFLDNIIERNNMVEYYQMHEANRTRRRQVVTANAGFNYNAPTGILAITYEAISPEYTRDVVDSIVAELGEWFRERGGLTRGRTLESLEETLAEVEREVASIESEIRAFQQQYGVLTVEEIAGAQAAIIRELEAELVALERSIRTYAQRTRIENDPELIRLRSERDTVVALIAQIEGGYSGGDRSMPARSELPELALRLRRLQADLAIQQRIRTSLQEQYEIARLSAENRPAFTILEAAEIPDEKIGPSRGQLCIIATFGGFAAAVALAFAHYTIKTIAANPKLMSMVKRSRS